MESIAVVGKCEQQVNPALAFAQPGGDPLRPAAGLFCWWSGAHVPRSSELVGFRPR